MRPTEKQREAARQLAEILAEEYGSHPDILHLLAAAREGSPILDKRVQAAVDQPRGPGVSVSQRVKNATIAYFRLREE